MNARAHRRWPSPTLSSLTSPQNADDPVLHRRRLPLRRGYSSPRAGAETPPPTRAASRPESLVSASSWTAAVLGTSTPDSRT
eukprot:2328217-Pleurochrysis_carterae.AAC.1